MDQPSLARRSRTGGARQTRIIVEAARRLIATKGASFTTQELVKEAGIAMQTFYRHFPSKDQLLVTVIENMVTEQVARYDEAARDLPDPVARLRRHVVAVLSELDGQDRAGAGPRFITSEHWRLHQLFPEEMARATRPYADLVARELRAAREAGLLAPADVDRDAALVAGLLLSMYHHHAFAPATEPAEAIAEHVWAFCLGGLGAASGAVTGPGSTTGPRSTTGRGSTVTEEPGGSVPAKPSAPRPRDDERT
ncbi:TetR/AcrR family transcriptional regulator [Frankia nepalensis]|uniref:TetR/AcrR family transcriptional regulator n=1 Tax=Frankia nepalensis TaxID=1836974 RepID=UPI0027DC2C5C|nr:TetR/AcrR family transcriptional regulator [Frankia nepalensis]